MLLSVITTLLLFITVFSCSSCMQQIFPFKKAFNRLSWVLNGSGSNCSMGHGKQLVLKKVKKKLPQYFPMTFDQCSTCFYFMEHIFLGSHDLFSVYRSTRLEKCLESAMFFLSFSLISNCIEKVNSGKFLRPTHGKLWMLRQPFFSNVQ